MQPMTKDHEQHSAADTGMPDNDHWLACYIRNLLHNYKANNGLDFATAEALLAQEKETFERELAMARRFYRLYPSLVDDATRNVESAARRVSA